MTAPHPILDLPMRPNDAQAETLRQYLIELLAKLIEEGEDMVKRPFGNSGWQYELYEPLLNAGLVSGGFDEDGYIDNIDLRQAEALIQQAIHDL